MKRMAFGIVVAAITTLPASAMAQSDPMTVYYASTLMCQGDNYLCYRWYYANGTYREFQTILRRDGLIAIHGYEGTYKATAKGDGYELCQTLDGGAHNWCRPLIAHKAGDTWEEARGNGEMEKNTLAAGRAHSDFSGPVAPYREGLGIAPYRYPVFPGRDNPPPSSTVNQ